MFILVEESPHSTHPKSLAPEKGLNDMGALLEKNRALKLPVNMVNLTWDVAVKICFHDNGLRLQSYKKSDTEQAREYPFVIQQISISLISVFPTTVAIIERIERHYWIATFLNTSRNTLCESAVFRPTPTPFFAKLRRTEMAPKLQECSNCCRYCLILFLIYLLLASQSTPPLNLPLKSMDIFETELQTALLRHSKATYDRPKSKFGI